MNYHTARNMDMHSTYPCFYSTVCYKLLSLSLQTQTQGMKWQWHSRWNNTDISTAALLLPHVYSGWTRHMLKSYNNTEHTSPFHCSYKTSWKCFKWIHQHSMSQTASPICVVHSMIFILVNLALSLTIDPIDVLLLQHWKFKSSHRKPRTKHKLLHNLLGATG